VQETAIDTSTSVMMDGAEQAQLILKIADSADKTAFAALFTYFAPRVKAYMFKMGSNDTMAEELAQKTMLQIWRKAKLYDPAKAAASTWIFRIARNLRIDELRKDSRFEYDEHDFALTADEADGPETTLDRLQHAKLVQNALTILSSEQYEIIQMSFYQGLSHSQISEKLSIPLGTVKSRMRLALSKLKTSVGDLA